MIGPRWPDRRWASAPEPSDCTDPPYNTYSLPPRITGGSGRSPRRSHRRPDTRRSPVEGGASSKTARPGVPPLADDGHDDQDHRGGGRRDEHTNTARMAQSDGIGPLEPSPADDQCHFPTRSYRTSRSQNATLASIWSRRGGTVPKRGVLRPERRFGGPALGRLHVQPPHLRADALGFHKREYPGSSISGTKPTRSSVSSPGTAILAALGCAGSSAAGRSEPVPRLSR